MADLKVTSEELKDESDSGRLTTPAAPPARRSSWPLVATAALAIATVMSAGAWWLRSSRPAPAPPNRLRQLTFDAGDSSYPTVSSDGKLVAYQSDRAGPGRYDIWVQQTSGGSAIRLTRGPANYQHPAFSGDGQKIYFESTGPPQGIFEMSTLGGEPRLVAPNSRNPTVSPDGRTLAYIIFPTSQLMARRLCVPPLVQDAPCRRSCRSRRAADSRCAPWRDRR
jgi:hypothetical protein